ncbi:hypothetical protein DAPPUDRAFT_112260 [Daphnia pulex]|uniref:Uncharacterized protein n=1 Tax=Daphnia pulex TaxID=6669 RepID=E9HBF4_DAPPU|nr:hypothetical protein DAPPUDRAFT_112260 [Daphnia pulex]|eukprot:EFX70833.1 hypothetical protein DAPPUDRAFT_112260 [Daphnia pulex]
MMKLLMTQNIGGKFKILITKRDMSSTTRSHQGWALFRYNYVAEQTDGLSLVKDSLQHKQQPIANMTESVAAPPAASAMIQIGIEPGTPMVQLVLFHRTEFRLAVLASGYSAHNNNNATTVCIEYVKAIFDQRITD